MRYTLFVLAMLLLGGCGAASAPRDAFPRSDDAVPAGGPAVERDAVAAFMSALEGHCGQAFEGRIVINQPQAANDPFAARKLVMHVRECGEAIRIPFHVGDDRSRTWVLTRTGTGLRLQHDHRHEDGSSDALTMYGGDSRAPGTDVRQEFPADAYSKDLFQRRNIAVSIANVWAMEIEPGRRFVYELARPGRLFRVEFDLTRPVPLPPAPWGTPPSGTPPSGTPPSGTP